ncbi:diguanylate cyclase domain-containing protein [Geothrix sp. 21YS21S-2]|uniref:sensor domain-containing protein n=1 Tax=Geothrix sp. 21YS21S-2 TaxID=3068893 RepID=UPI0027B8A28C|nr:diguanylate cyclase [Geothrix sp. 21YS21S-2]
MDPINPAAAPSPFLNWKEPREVAKRLKVLIKAIEQSPVSVIITDPKGVIQYVNPKFTQLMGFSLEEAVGQTPRILKGGFLTRDFYKNMWDTIQEGREWHGLFHNRTKGGDLVWELASISPIRDDFGTITHFVGVKEDITELKRLQDQMAHMAHHDQLTGLPNRFLFLDRLGQMLAQAKRRDTTFAVLYLDLDDFKAVNDTRGHAAGDSLLTAVAQRLMGCVRETDTVSRMGGDEFTILLADIHDMADVERIVGMILKAISNPFTIGAGECSVGISIGVAIYPLDGLDTDPLLSAADSALYKVKADGRGGYCFPSRNLGLPPA